MGAIQGPEVKHCMREIQNDLHGDCNSKTLINLINASQPFARSSVGFITSLAFYEDYLFRMRDQAARMAFSPFGFHEEPGRKK